MGGGDLNSKKAWHPNTLKNQERVWKAEQAAAEEKKRIMELQRERAEERDRENLNEIAKRAAGGGSSSVENRLHWMYDKPDKKGQHEDYLLGKSIDSKYEEVDKGSQDFIPAVARRVVGASTLATSTDTQVDLARKLREDPLLLIKERERAARAALLNNPLQRRRLTELLRKEQEQSKKNKDEKKLKSKSKDLDNILAAKLNALGAKNGLDLKTLLASDDSSDSSDSSVHGSKNKKKKRKDKKKIKKRKKDKNIDKCQIEDSVTSELKKSKKDVRKKSFDIERTAESTECKKKKRKSEDEGCYDEVQSKKQRQSSKIENKYYDRACNDPNEELDKRHSKQEPTHNKDYKRHIEKGKHKSKVRVGMSDKEKAAKLAEMAAAGAEREVQRGRRVALQLAEKEASEKSSIVSRHYTHNEARALPESLESRIHSNRHYIQRDRRHMDEHFARR
ncbi:unnamed protein product, partial [Iphiclides podalirius]